MFTGSLHDEDSSGNYSGFFKDTGYANQNESGFKFFMATTAQINTIAVKTNSYLYNDVLTNDVTLKYGMSYNSSTTLPGNDTYEGKDIDYGYPLGNPNYELLLAQGYNYEHYQLDTTHKTPNNDSSASARI